VNHPSHITYHVSPRKGAFESSTPALLQFLRQELLTHGNINTIFRLWSWGSAVCPGPCYRSKGANAYIVKTSFDQSNLLEVIKRMIYAW